MQIAGHKCHICNRSIVLSNQGKFCPRCEIVVHVACEPRPVCGSCGKQFEAFKLPKSDPAGDAVLPRALRPAKMDGPVMVLAALFAILFGFIIYCFWWAVGHQH
jgi:transposase-like protein